MSGTGLYVLLLVLVACSIAAALDAGLSGNITSAAQCLGYGAVAALGAYAVRGQLRG